MFQERNHASGDTDHLLRRNVHVVNLGPGHFKEVTTVAHRYERIMEIAILLQRGIRLSNHKALFLVRRKVFHLIGDIAVLHLAIGTFDKTEIIHTGIDTQRGNQTNIRTFRSLDRTNTTVVTAVNVSNFETSTLTAQPSWSQGTETTLVG